MIFISACDSKGFWFLQPHVWKGSPPGLSATRSSHQTWPRTSIVFALRISTPKNSPSMNILRWKCPIAHWNPYYFFCVSSRWNRNWRPTAVFLNTGEPLDRFVLIASTWKTQHETLTFFVLWILIPLIELGVKRPSLKVIFGNFEDPQPSLVSRWPPWVATDLWIDQQVGQPSVKRLRAAGRVPRILLWLQELGII